MLDSNPIGKFSRGLDFQKKRGNSFNKVRQSSIHIYFSNSFLMQRVSGSKNVYEKS
jgi:hypothetical protein